jgi:hypothetical protein
MTKLERFEMTTFSNDFDYDIFFNNCVYNPNAVSVKLIFILPSPKVRQAF